MFSRGRPISGCAAQRPARWSGFGHDLGPDHDRRREAQLPRYSDFISSALAGRTPIAREPDADAPCACAP